MKIVTFGEIMLRLSKHGAMRLNMSRACPTMPSARRHSCISENMVSTYATR